jgi:hypothetical protein
MSLTLIRPIDALTNIAELKQRAWRFKSLWNGAVIRADEWKQRALAAEAKLLMLQAEGRINEEGNVGS